MKTAIFLLFFFAFSKSVNSQIWGRNTFGQFTNEAVDVEVDASGNSYITGYLTGETAFQTDVVILNGYSGDAYVAKYSSFGALIWVKTFGGNFSDRATDLAIGPDGNIVFTGQFFGTANFGSISLTSPAGSKDIFIAKLDPVGDVIWAIREGGTDAENAYGVTVDHQNNVLLTGQFKGNSTIAGQTFSSTIDPLTGLPSFDFFVAKYDSNGNPLWIRNGVADYEDRGLAVSVDDQDNVFMTGQFSDTLQFCGNTYNNMSYNLGFVTKLSPTGNLLFFNKIQAGMSVPWDVKVDEENKVVVAGDFLGNMNYIDQTGLHPITNPYSKQGFLIKLENDGSYIWDYTIGSENPFSLKSIAIDVHEDIYATGWFECTLSQTHDTIIELWNSVGFRDPYLLKVGKLGGHEYIKQFGGKLDDEGHGVALLQNDEAVICGMFKSNLNVKGNSTSSLSSPSVTNNFRLHTYGSVYNNKMNGDDSPNSFLLTGIDENSYDYNYFLQTNFASGLPNDSLMGFISPYLDTLHLCHLDTIEWSAEINYGLGPSFNYLWNTGQTSRKIAVPSTGEYSVQVTRKDECFFDQDTIFVQYETIPPLPLMTDDDSIHVHHAPYQNFRYCYPDTINLVFDSLPIGVTYTFSSSNLTTPSYSNNYDTISIFENGHFIITSQNQYCTKTEDFYFNFDYVIPYDSIDLGIVMNTLTGTNDSIVICSGQEVHFRGVDYITNPSGNWIPVPNPIVSYDFSTGTEYNPVSMFKPYYSSGWKYISLHLVKGYMNKCGIDTVHYYVTDSFYVHVNPLPNFNTTLSGDNLLCQNGSVFMTTTYTHPNLNWTGPAGGIIWTSNDEDSIEIALPGVYRYQGTLIDTNTGCSRFVSFYDTIKFKKPPLIVSDPSDRIICPYDSVLLSIPNTYTDFVWVGPNNDTLSTTNTCYGDIIGNYYCHMIDNEGCPLTTLPVQLNEYSTPSIFIFPDPYICPGEEVTIGVAYSGEPTFVWHPNGETTDEIVVTQAGVYFVEIEQCGFTVQDSIEIFDGGFSATISVNDTLLCANEQAVLIGSHLTGSYEWNNGEITGPSYQTNESGTYFATVTNEFGCETQTNTITILQVPNSGAPTISDITICPGADATLNSIAQTYWYSSDTVLIDTSAILTILSVQNDTVIYVAFAQDLCPVLISDVAINVQDTLITSEILMDSLLCANQGTSAQVITNGTNFEWFIDGVLVGITNPINLTSAQIGNGGMISVQIGSSCSQISISDSIEILAITPITANQDTLFGCVNDSISLSINEIFSPLIWEQGILVDTASNYQAVVNTSPYTVSVSGIDQNGCPTNELNFIVSPAIPASPLILNDTNICIGSDLVLSSSDTLNWYTADSVLIQTVESISFLNIQNDTLIYYSNPAQLCSETLEELVITVNGNLVFDSLVGDFSLCNQESSTLELVSNATSIDWYISGGLVGSGEFFNVFNSGLSPSTSVTVIYSNACLIDTLIVSITNLPEPQISITDNLIISCAYETISASIYENMETVFWTTNSGVLEMDTLSYQIQNYQETIIVNAIDSNGCISNNEILTIQPSTVLFDFSINNPTNCYNDSAQISFTTSADTFLITSPIGQIDTNYFEIALNGQTSGNYIAWIQDTMGCIYHDTLVVSPYQLPIFDLGTDTVLCIDDIFTYYFPNDTNQFVWTTYGGDENIPILSDQQLILTATSPQGCVFSDSLFVMAVDCNNALPNFITPNGDGANDFFYIDDALVYTNSRLIIENRYGQVVFSADGYQNNWSGQECVEGVYFYRFYPNPSLEPNRFTQGFVHLMK